VAANRVAAVYDFEAPSSEVLDGASEFLERETGFEPATLSLGKRQGPKK